MKVAALIGSNRGEKSTSASLMRYLEKQLNPHGISVSFFFARGMYTNAEKREEFNLELRNMTSGDLVIICAPDYVDSLPAPLIFLMENLRDTLGSGSLAGIRLMAVVHSGYPEPQQRKPGLEICRFFAQTMGMEWCGGLGFGGTSPINGQPLETSGPFGKRLLPVLDRTSAQIASGNVAKTQELVLEDVSSMPLPAWMVSIMMNAMTKRKARKEKQDLRTQPYRVD